MAVGAIYEQLGNREMAESRYRKALEINPNFAPAANNLAWNLAYRGKNIDEALGFARIAKEQSPKNSSIMDTLGWIFYLKGSYLNAIAELQDSLELEPNNPVINYHMGMAYYKSNKTEAAKTYLERALEINQSFNGAKEAQIILKNIKNAT